MDRYICELFGSADGRRLTQRVTVASEELAVSWFKAACPDEKIEFSGFHLTESYPTNWVSASGADLGEITRIPGLPEQGTNGHPQ